MNPVIYPTQLALTGQSTAVLTLAVPLAFVVSLWLLWLYLGAVRRSMLRRGDVDWNAKTSTPAEARTGGNVLPPLAFADARQALPSSAAAAASLLGAARSRRRASALAVTGGGIVFAAAMALVYMTANGIPLLPFRFLFLTVCHGWPLVMALGLLLAVSWRGWLLLVGLYAALLGLVALPALSDTFKPVMAAALWGLINLPATVPALLFLARRIRAVGPLVLTLAIFVIGGANVILTAVGASDGRIRLAAAIGDKLGLDGYQAFIATSLLGAILLGIVGWALLRGIGRLYQNRAISDQAITIDALWLLFAVVTGIDLAFAGAVWFFAALAVFVLYRIVTRVGLAVAGWGRTSPESPPRLLLLRVFSLGKRSERLFDSFASVWRYAGTMRLIAGPDLATTTVEPHEFLDFLSGRLSRRFIADPETLDQRLTEAAGERDFDGRYRVTDLFCHDTTWKMVLRRLARDSDAVLMDLRGFGPVNKGCVFEIHELMALCDINRAVFVVDAATDMDFLKQSFAEGWAILPPSSPGRSAKQPAAHLLRVERDRDVAHLLTAVAQAARP